VAKEQKKKTGKVKSKPSPVSVHHNKMEEVFEDVELSQTPPSAPEDNSVQKPSRLGVWDGNSSLRLYMKELGEVTLLTPEEEVELAAKIKKGDAQAREKMIKANLRLVVKIARDYEGMGLPLLDLINEGNLGLMRGVTKFDPAKGGKFSTYGSWWIKQNIRRAIANHSKTIRLPIHLKEKISKMRQFIDKFRQETGHEPQDEDLAAELNLPVHKVTMLREANLPTVSLDAPLGEEGDTSLGDIVSDDAASTPYQHLEQKTMRQMLTDVLNTLDEREAGILRCRFGLDGGSEKTLDEVGMIFKVTRERVRQIQNIALAKMRVMIEEIEKEKLKNE
jgi:RNA polymerase primary sigma factor